MQSVPSGRLSFKVLAWRHLMANWESSAGVAVALLLIPLPGALLVVDAASARSDLGAVVAGSGGVILQRVGVASATAYDTFQQQAQSQVAGRLAQYFDNGHERAAVGPFRVDSVNSVQRGTPASATNVEVAYISDLAARVEVVQGVVRGPRALGPTASMSLAGAHRIGVNLFDAVCLRALVRGAAGQSPWCVRIVGLWRPTRPADSRLMGGNSDPQLFADRDEFFALSGAEPPELAVASRLYRPGPATIAPQDAARVAESVRGLRASITVARLGEVRSSLDGNLERYVAARSAVSFPLRLLTASLVPLPVLLIWTLGRWYVALRLHELALLGARGWASLRVQGFVLAQFAMLGASTTAIAGAGLMLAWPAELGSTGLKLISPSPSELSGIAIVEGSSFAAVAACLIGLARWATAQSVLQLTRPEAESSPSPSWWLADRGVRIALPALLLLLLPRAIGTERWLASGTLGDLSGLAATVAAFVVLVVATLPAMSRAAELTSTRRGQVEDVDGMLAQWQLRRWWQRHAPDSFVIVFAFAMASFAAITLAYRVVDRAGAGSPFGQASIVGVALGLASLVAVALLAYGLVFLFACRSRVHDYTALMVDGLPAAELGRSLGIEQHTVLMEGLLVGVGLGLLLSWTTWSIVDVGGGVGTFATSAVIGAVLITTIGASAGVGVAWIVRRIAVGFPLVEPGRLGA
jgi:hypothetical protein